MAAALVLLSTTATLLQWQPPRYDRCFAALAQDSNANDPFLLDLEPSVLTRLCGVGPVAYEDSF